MEKNTVKVMDSEGNLLFSCPLEEKDRAHAYCCQLESMGVEAVLEAPTLPESLAFSLGMAEEERGKLAESVDFEIAEHE